MARFPYQKIVLAVIGEKRKSNKNGSQGNEKTSRGTEANTDRANPLP
jgi:hypothetical protein